MKRNDFNLFKAQLVNSGFTGDVMKCGYAFLQCTEKQITELKGLALGHAKEYKSLENGAIQVGAYIFK